MHLDLSARLARRYGARVALTDASRGGSLSFTEVEQRAASAAERLRALGVRSGERISVLSGPDVDMVVLLFGALKVGAVLVPHNLRLTPTELSADLERIRPNLLVRGRLVPGELASVTVPGRPTAALDELTRPEAAPTTRPTDLPDWEAPALVLFTGGSTGRPKGAVLSLRALFMNALTTAEGWKLTGDDSTITVFPMFHTGGWNVLLLPLLIVGGRTVFFDRFDPVEVLRLVDAEKSTILGGVPAMFIDMVHRPEFAKASLTSLRFAKSGGGNSPPAVVKAFRDRGIPFYQGYGLTEAGPNLLYSTAEDLERPGTIGRANLLCEMRLVDEHGNDSDLGELLVGGPILFSGYLDNPEATAAAMSGPYVRTGDVLRRDADGFYFFVGRTKLMYKSGGENVYIAEVEQVLETHASVVESAVIGVPDPKWGEVGRAYLVERAPVSDDDLRRYLRERLAAFKVPKSFVRLPEIPHTRAGKKDYPLLVREGKS
jgi:fatty-acyl-CoA synthase